MGETIKELEPTIIVELDERFGRETGIEVRHQRGNVLGSGQPRVHIVAGVQEAAGGDRNVLHHVTVEWEFERQLNGLCEWEIEFKYNGCS